jgi:hypothetical protein
MGSSTIISGYITYISTIICMATGNFSPFWLMKAHETTILYDFLRSLKHLKLKTWPRGGLQMPLEQGMPSPGPQTQTRLGIGGFLAVMY